MLTDIIPKIIEEPALAGCAPGNETIGYLAGEISRLRSALRNIAQFGRHNTGCGYTCAKMAEDALCVPPNAKANDGGTSHD